MSVLVMLDNGRGYEFDDETPLNRAELEAAALAADRAKRRGGKWAEFVLRGGVPDGEHDAAVAEWWRLENGRSGYSSADLAVPTRRLSRAERFELQQFVRGRLGLGISSWSVFTGEA